MTDEKKKFNKEFFDDVINAKEYRDLEKAFPEIHNAAAFNNGRIAIGEQERFLANDETTAGEKVVSIRNDNSTSKDGRSRYMVKDIMAKAYNIPNPNNYEYVGYKDNNPLNCNADNLEYVKENPYPNTNPIKSNSATYVIVDNRNNVLETASTIDNIQKAAGYVDKVKFRGGICGFKQALPSDSRYPGCFVGKRYGESAIEFEF